MAQSEAGRGMGHEAVGVVEAVGAEVSSVKVGDVIVMPFAYSDGSCVFCREAIHTSCVHGGFFGTGEVDGGQAERCVSRRQTARSSSCRSARMTR